MRTRQFVGGRYCTACFVCDLHCLLRKNLNMSKPSENAACDYVDNVYMCVSIITGIQFHGSLVHSRLSDLDAILLLTAAVNFSSFVVVVLFILFFLMV